MANDDPENELGHFSLGKALMEAGEFTEAASAFERALALNPEFSKAYQLLGSCYAEAGNRAKAVEILREGIAVADSRGDRMPREEMASLLRQLGGTPPEPPKETAASGTETGFRCHRPGCQAGKFAQRMDQPPMNDELGRLIQEKVCADCWREWLAMGVKVINELRLDFSDDRPIYGGQTASQVYDQYMLEFLGLK